MQNRGVTVLDPSLHNNLVELIAANFRANEINELGKLVLGTFDANRLSGIQSHISLSPRKSANLLVEQAAACRQAESLIKLVVELDQGILIGRQINVEVTNGFTQRRTLKLQLRHTHPRRRSLLC